MINDYVHHTYYYCVDKFIQSMTEKQIINYYIAVLFIKMYNVIILLIISHFVRTNIQMTDPRCIELLFY